MGKCESSFRYRAQRSASAFVAAVVVAVALAGCTRSGSNATPDSPSAGKPAPTAAQTVEANKAQVATRLAKSAIVRIVLPPADESDGMPTTYEIQPAGSGTVSPVRGSPGYFKAMKDGTVTIVAEQKPPCSPGKACSSAETEVGAVVITVAG